MYFKRQVGMVNHPIEKNRTLISFFLFLELSTMYRTMESKNYLTPEDAITDLKDEYEKKRKYYYYFFFK